jgi:hypothetical protein
MNAPSVKVPDRDGPVGVVNTPRRTFDKRKGPLSCRLSPKGQPSGFITPATGSEEVAPTR